MDSTDQEVLDAALTLIHSRQHTSPKRLGDPGPDAEQIEKILSAAGAAGHGRLHLHPVTWTCPPQAPMPRKRRAGLGSDNHPVRNPVDANAKAA
jgi:hypothetical protein